MYLPLLVHVAVVLMDAPEPLLYQHCQQLLVNLLYSLSARHLEVHHAAGTRLSEYRMVRVAVGQHILKPNTTTITCPHTPSSLTGDRPH